jgi:hypothetical protein
VLASFIISSPVDGNSAVIMVVSSLWALWSASTLGWNASVFKLSSDGWCTHTVENVNNNVIIAIVLVIVGCVITNIYCNSIWEISVGWGCCWAGTVLAWWLLIDVGLWFVWLDIVVVVVAVSVSVSVSVSVTIVV